METNAVVTMSDSPSAYEPASLRQELILRIRLQNTLLIFSVGAFVAFAVVTALVPRTAWPLTAAANTVMLALALQWCHHGVRTKQIKQYLLRLDPNEQGWERWLPAHRPKTLLGSRWMISTKGVFLGFGLAQAALAWLVAPTLLPLPALIAAGLWLATAGFLFTNPKE